VGKTVSEAFNWAHRLELACRTQLAAMACNSPLRDVPQVGAAHAELRLDDVVGALVVGEGLREYLLAVAGGEFSRERPLDLAKRAKAD
jgi:ribulose-5-phosphate 4-epimerase/fuculose-1-phosphate aldolase